LSVNRLLLVGTVGACALSAGVVVPQADRMTPFGPSAPAVIWRTSGEGRGRPATDGSTAFFLTARHEVLALDAKTGVLNWRRSTGEPGESTAGSAVVVVGSVVVAGDYNLVAFDRQTGSIRWRFIPAVGYAPGLYLGDTAGSLVLAGSPAGRIYALLPATGDLLWTVQVIDGPATVFAPATDGRVVAAGYTVFGSPATGGVVCVDAASGRERWRAVFPRSPDPLLGTGSAGGPVIAGTAVIASSGDGRVYGFDRDTGAVLWSLPAVDRIPPIIQGPLKLPGSMTSADYRPLAASRSLLFVGSLKGDVIAYDLATRREAWRHLDLPQGSVSFGLASDDRSVYVPYASGRHAALAIATGHQRWRTTDPADGLIWPSASDARRVFMAGRQGGFIAVRK
jgi:outer membrane protein assembly factor BamB